MKLITKKIKDLKPAKYNPRDITHKAMRGLKKSIEEFGYVEPIIYNKTTGHIVGGHQRYQVLKSRGEKEIEVIEVELDEIKEKALNLSLNNQHIQGNWTDTQLQKLLDELKIELPTYEELKLESLELPMVEQEKLKDIEEVIDEENLQNSKQISQKNDLWLLGEHRLLCGDSTQEENIKRVLDGQKPILMVTDPPYGVDYSPENRVISTRFMEKHKCSEDRKVISTFTKKHKRNVGKVQNDTRINWSEVYKLIDCSVCYIWYATWYTLEVFKSLIDLDYQIISQIIWAKQVLVLSRGDYHFKHEPCLYVVKKGAKHNWQGSRKETTLWEISNNNPIGNNNMEEKLGHSTQKPIECMARPIRNNSKAGDLICDPFLGSGTTLIAAEQLDRICYGLEIFPAYCDIIINRWQKLTGRKVMREDGVLYNDLLGGK